MRTVLLFLISIVILSSFFSCIPPEQGNQRSSDKIELNLTDPTVQKLYDFRDKRLSDSLAKYFTNQDATLRYLAALAFASSGDSSQINGLAQLLQDPVEDVRIAAAFALGQTKAAAAEPLLTAAFDGKDSLSNHQRFNAVILEAIGKCGSLESLRQMAAITTYEKTDTLLLEGRNRAIFQFALRNITDPTATEIMLRNAANDRLPNSARLMAAHYLARTPDFKPDSLQATRLAAAYVRATDPDVRMALATALGKSSADPAFSILTKVIENERDWRVTCNIIRALGKFEPDTVRRLLTPYLSDPNPHISRTAAEFFIQHGTARDADLYWRTARDLPKLPWPTRVALYHASNKWLTQVYKPDSRDYVVYQLREQFLKSDNPYERAACLKALAETGWQFRWIYSKGIADSHPAVKTAAAEALAAIANKKDFFQHLGEGAGGARREIYNHLREVVASGDPGMIAASANGFMAPALNYRSLRDTSRIRDFNASLAALKMPRDLEAYMELKKVIAFFEEKPEPAPYVPRFNHPIDWTLLTTMEAGQRVRMQTNKGVVDLELYPQWAPGSVVNFIKLINDGFYNGKTTHRVVPNFVVQGGCPRGDGYGALDYTIRSEIGLCWYDQAGYLGMASAGRDTEGTQWFITHSPTPHLDGRYTIFGKVAEGMDVVNTLEVGDRIEKIELVKK
jgi:cyclophilin family peptidyl-prolyl cis-trans isomerase/HEAT repeat protein